MANIKSAKKRARTNPKRRSRNRHHLGLTRSKLKKARQALESGDVEAAREAVREATSQLDHAASKGVLHKNNASRRKSRLMQQLNALEESAE
jgi:small subunit ribosomal protein S20